MVSIDSPLFSGGKRVLVVGMTNYESTKAESAKDDTMGLLKKNPNF